MGDPAMALRHDFVTRAHDMLAGADLDLPRPDQTGQRGTKVDSSAGKRADRFRDRNNRLLAPRVEADRTCRDRRRMTVLHPKDDPLAGCRRRETGITFGRPGVGVVGAGQRTLRRGARLPVGVERVFGDVVAGGADDVNEQLAGKIAEPEAVANLPTVDCDRAGPRAAGFAPFGDDLAIAVEQGQPAADFRRAVAGPIVRRHYSRV